MKTVIYNKETRKTIALIEKSEIDPENYNNIIHTILKQSPLNRTGFIRNENNYNEELNVKLFPNFSRKHIKIQSDILQLTRKNAALSKLSSKSAYFSVMRGHDSVVRLYFRDTGPFSGNNGYAAYSESPDGIKFLKPNSILQNELMCHNFFPFLDTNPDAIPEQKYKAVARNINSVATFASPDGKNWTPINMHAITPDHPGILKKRTNGGEFDGHMCCFFDKFTNKYVLYTRCNYEVSIRHIQLCYSSDFIKWGEFSMINLSPEFNFSLDNYYYPGFYPINIPEYDYPIYFGIIPYSIRKYTCFDWMISNNLKDWKIIHSDMYDTGWKYRGTWRNKNHPVVGHIISNDKKSIYFYVHENYAKNSSGKDIKISRFEIPTYKFYNAILSELSF